MREYVDVAKRSCPAQAAIINRRLYSCRYVPCIHVLSSNGTDKTEGRDALWKFISTSFNVQKNMI